MENFRLLLWITCEEKVVFYYENYRSDTSQHSPKISTLLGQSYPHKASYIIHNEKWTNRAI